MQKRFVSIWFRHLKTDWYTRRHPGLHAVPFVLAAPDHGRMVVTAVNALAENEGIFVGMVVADARAVISSIQVFDDDPHTSLKALKGFAEWFIRYTPAVAIDEPDGLLLDITGCAHLWGGENQYLTDINMRLKQLGYVARTAMADTIGAAWAIARFGKSFFIIETGQQTTALLPLPPAALRIKPDAVERLEKLGLRQVGSFITMQRSALRRRFGQQFLIRLDQATGAREEFIQPVIPIEPYQERLPCLEPIATATGIEIALQKLLEALCTRLKKEARGLRKAFFKGYRIDGKIVQIEIGTNRPSSNPKHLFKLFELKMDTIEPALGIELFILEAHQVEDISPVQEMLWQNNGALTDNNVSELLDRIGGKLGDNNIHRYLPDEHYWPERSFKPAVAIDEKKQTEWKADKPRPVQILSSPELIEVTAPIPDYPPMMFRYRNILHKIVNADGPERIEQEWWLQEGQHRDYYIVEDEEGRRYWLFRSGHYDAAKSYKWFIHGFFA